MAQIEVKVPEQVVDVPKIILEDIPGRALVRGQQLVEQVVVVPVPEPVLVARGPDSTGTEWRQYVGTGGTYWCMGRTTYTRRERPFGFTASPGRDIKLGKVEAGARASGCGRPCALQRQVPAVQGVRPDCASSSECGTLLLWNREEYAQCDVDDNNNNNNNNNSARALYRAIIGQQLHPSRASDLHHGCRVNETVFSLGRGGGGGDCRREGCPHVSPTWEVEPSCCSDPQ